MMHFITNFPSSTFLVLSFSSYSRCWTNAPFIKLQTMWVFLPLAVVSSNLSPRLHENCCFQHAINFYGGVFAVRSEDTIWFGSVFHRAIPTPNSFLYFSKTFALSTKHHLPTTCWMVAIVSTSGKLGKKSKMRHGECGQFLFSWVFLSGTVFCLRLFRIYYDNHVYQCNILC